MKTRLGVLAACMLLAMAAPGGWSAKASAEQLEATEQAAPAADGWRPMEGTWSVAGRRQTLAMPGGRPAATMQLSGAIVLAVGDGLSRGFRGEFIGFDDGDTLSVGRFVWTDEHGDQVFGHVKGEPVQTGRQFVGTITGGTGRYAGITGEYAFTWQSVIEADGVVQGRTSGLRGRYRRAGGRP